jgi:Glu/Leu/Phe/Val dehydrogenase, dimerisation domain
MEPKAAAAARSNPGESPEDLNPSYIAAQRFDRATALLPQYRRGLIDFLQRPARTVIVEFPIELADGSVRDFTGYRVLHSQVRGPGKGGIHYHPEVTFDDTSARRKKGTVPPSSREQSLFLGPAVHSPRRFRYLTHEAGAKGNSQPGERHHCDQSQHQKRGTGCPRLLRLLGAKDPFDRVT